MDAPRDSGPDGFGLLVGILLEHVVVVAALLGGLEVPVDIVDRAFQLAADEVGDGDVTGMDVRDVAILEEDDAAGVRQHRRHVRSQEHLVLPEPDDRGHVHPGTDHAVGLALVDDRQRIGTVGPPQGRADGLGEVAVVGLLHEMGDGLGIGLRAEHVTGRLELGAQLDEVLDDAVVDDRQLPGAVHVGMGIEIVGATMRGPAGMAQSGRGRGCITFERLAQHRELAGPLLDEEIAGPGDEGDTSRVVAAILQAGEPLQQQRCCFVMADVADDAAHR